MKSAASVLSREQHAAINKMYHDLLGASDIMDDLARNFELHTMVKRHEGKVDQAATLAACGAYEVLSYIRQRIKLGAQGK
jgi:hypothetical protein